MIDVEEADADLAAIELAFGLLDPGAVQAAEAREHADRNFAAEVDRWRAYLTAWLAAGEQAPPPSLWPRIAAAVAANDDAQLATAGQVRFWRSAAAVAAAAALVFGIAGVRRAPVPAPMIRRAPAPVLAALLSSPQKTKAAMTVTLTPGRDRLLAIPASVSVGSGAAELWVIPAGGAPVSLGVIAATAPSSTSLAPDRVRLFVAGATIAVSREPMGGSPTGQPTGPVILAGPLVAI